MKMKRILNYTITKFVTKLLITWILLFAVTDFDVVHANGELQKCVNLTVPTSADDERWPSCNQSDLIKIKSVSQSRSLEKGKLLFFMETWCNRRPKCSVPSTEYDIIWRNYPEQTLLIIYYCTSEESHNTFCQAYETTTTKEQILYSPNYLATHHGKLEECTCKMSSKKAGSITIFMKNVTMTWNKNRNVDVKGNESTPNVTELNHQNVANKTFILKNSVSLNYTFMIKFRRPQEDDAPIKVTCTKATAGPITTISTTTTNTDQSDMTVIIAGGVAALIAGIVVIIIMIIICKKRSCCKFSKDATEMKLESFSPETNGVDSSAGFAEPRDTNKANYLLATAVHPESKTHLADTLNNNAHCSEDTLLADSTQHIADTQIKETNLKSPVDLNIDGKLNQSSTENTVMLSPSDTVTESPYDEALPANYVSQGDNSPSGDVEIHNGHPYFLYDKDYNKGKRILADDTISGKQSSSDTTGSASVLTSQNLDYAYSYMKTKGSDIQDRKPINNSQPYSYASFKEMKPHEKALPATYSYADNRAKVVPGITKHIVGDGYTQETATTEDIITVPSTSAPNTIDPYSYAGTENNNDSSTQSAVNFNECGDIESKPAELDMDGYQQIDSSKELDKRLPLPSTSSSKTEGMEYQEIDTLASNNPNSNLASSGESSQIAGGVEYQEVCKPASNLTATDQSTSGGAQSVPSRDSVGAYQEITFDDNENPEMKSTFTKDGIELLPNDVYGQLN